MSRTLRRVPLTFIWPLDQVWGGYINPYSAQATNCPACKNGYAPAAARMDDEWYGYAPFDPVAYGAKPLTVDHPSIRALAEWNCPRSAWMSSVDREADRLLNLMRAQWSHHLIQADVDALIAAGRLWDFTHSPRTAEQVAIVESQRAAGGNSWLAEPNGYTPTADEVNAWSIGGMGHDSINANCCIRARCEREGYALICPVCNGTATAWPSKEIEALSDAWERTDPPEGEGYQLWETCSEGSPQTPIFTTLDELCHYAAEHCNTFGYSRATFEEWRHMLSPDGFVHHTADLGHVKIICV